VISGERSCYDEGKRTAETLAMDYHRGAGVEVGHVFVELIGASLDCLSWCILCCWMISLV